MVFNGDADLSSGICVVICFVIAVQCFAFVLVFQIGESVRVVYDALDNFND